MSASRHPAVAAADVEREWDDPALGKRTITPARARVRSLQVPAIENVEDRVEYIATLMLEEMWTDHTSRECQYRLASAWKVDPVTVRRYSAEASRKLHELAREEGGRYARTALRTLTTVAVRGRRARLPGDMSAAVMASEKLLKFAGLAEPEEDKQRPTTLVAVGQVVASPVFGALLAGHEPKKLNGQANGQAGGHAESPDLVPASGCDRSLVRET